MKEKELEYIFTNETANLFQGEEFKSYLNRNIGKHGPLGFNINNDTALIFNARLAMVLFSSDIEGVNLATKAIEHFDGTKYQKQYSEGYFYGRNYFHEYFYVTGDTFMKNSKAIVRSLHDLYFHNSPTHVCRLKNKISRIPYTISSESMLEWGVYHGVNSGVFQLMMLHQKDFLKYRFYRHDRTCDITVKERYESSTLESKIKSPKKYKQVLAMLITNTFIDEDANRWIYREQGWKSAIITLLTILQNKGFYGKDELGYNINLSQEETKVIISHEPFNQSIALSTIKHYRFSEHQSTNLFDFLNDI